MLQTNTTTFPSGSPFTPLEPPSSLRRPTHERVPVRSERQSELAIDDALAGSFPASDPPAWNPGMARPIPVGTPRNRDVDLRPSEVHEGLAATPAVIDVSRWNSSERTVLQALISFAGAAAVALLVPLAILLLGLPIALAVRGLLEMLIWLFPAIG